MPQPRFRHEAPVSGQTYRVLARLAPLRHMLPYGDLASPEIATRNLNPAVPSITEPVAAYPFDDIQSGNVMLLPTQPQFT